MQAFEYANPKTLQEAIGLLGSDWEDAAVLAGGTDLVSRMKDSIDSPKRVVNIKNLKGLDGIEKTSSGLRIGAATKVASLANNDTIRSEYGGLHHAAQLLGSMQIRNMGTIGGNLCQRPRCWYFRSGYGLLAMKDGKSLVPEGENRYHAIFPKAPAYFVSPSTLAPAFIAFGTKVKLVSPSGEREVSLADFFVAPDDSSEREIDLRPNEILTEIIVPPAGGAKSATYEIRQKEGMDWPLAMAAVALKMNGNKVSSAQIVMGQAGPTPVIAAEAANSLAGKTITEAVAESAGEAAVQGAQPLSDNAYKVQLAKVAVKRALLKAVS